jgi:hypothetical protein
VSATVPATVLAPAPFAQKKTVRFLLDQHEPERTFPRCVTAAARREESTMYRVLNKPRRSERRHRWVMRPTSAHMLAPTGAVVLRRDEGVDNPNFGAVGSLL